MGPSLSDPARRRLAALLGLWLALGAICPAAEPKVPLWLVSNGYHTSVGLRVQDAPFARQLAAVPGTRIVLIGWGATDIYHGKITSFTIGRAVFGSSSLLHVVSLKRPIRERFQHSDIVRLELPRSRYRELVQEFERSFAHDDAGRLGPSAPGWYQESRFYHGAERFYFPKICNTWIAVKLHRQGVQLCVPCCILAPNLISEAARQGVVESRRSHPRDGY